MGILSFSIASHKHCLQSLLLMTIARSLIALSCLVTLTLFSACSSDSNPSDSGNSEPPIAVGKLSFMVGSTTKTDNADAAVLSQSPLVTVVQSHVDQQTQGFMVAHNINGTLKKGNYTIKDDATEGQVRTVMLYNQTPYIIKSGTFTITVLTDTSIAGTFSCNGHDMNDEMRLLAVHSGKFHVQRP